MRDPNEREKAESAAGEPIDAGDSNDSSERDGGRGDLSRAVVEEAERLTRLERNATVQEECETYVRERERLLAGHEYTARVREESTGDVLVCHPDEWVENGTIRTDRIEDLSRAVEIPLDGAADPDDWEAVDAANRDLVDAVREEHGDVHGDNAAALADFMSNHYAKSIESAGADELSEFLDEYFVRNAWPSDRQRETVERSIELVFETAGKSAPEYQ